MTTNNALSSSRHISLLGGSLRLYADGRLRRVDEAGEEKWIRPSVAREMLSSEEQVTFDAWRADGDVTNRALGITR